MNAYLSTYQNTQVNTASPEQLLIMLYEGALRFVKEAQQAIKEKNKITKTQKINKVVHIVSELSDSLDREVGGDLAENLENLYDYMLRELLAANLNDDMKSLQVVEQILTELKEAWNEAIRNNGGKKQAAPIDHELQEPPTDYSPLKSAAF